MQVTPDHINALFEVFGGIFILNHCRQLYKDKHVAGVSILSVAFFVTWGLFNIFYYPHLNQTFSYYAAIFMTACNFLWVIMLTYYSKSKA